MVGISKSNNNKKVTPKSGKQKSAGKPSSKPTRKTADKPVDAVTVRINSDAMPSRLKNKVLTYTATMNKVYIAWLYKSVFSEEHVDALISISESLNERFQADRNLTIKEIANVLPEDYVDITESGVSTAVSSNNKNGECEVTLL